MTKRCIFVVGQQKWYGVHMVCFSYMYTYEKFRYYSSASSNSYNTRNVFSVKKMQNISTFWKRERKVPEFPILQLGITGEEYQLFLNAKW